MTTLDRLRSASPGRAASAAPALTLREGEVHVWLVDLDVPPPGLLRHLDAKHACRSLMARETLIGLLASYTGIPAGEIVLQEGKNGKPFLQTGQDGEMTLEFNLSHSENLALYAFSWNRRLGVDIEGIRDIGADVTALSRAFLTGEERALFEACPQAHRSRLLYRYWTCKEALVKAANGMLDDMRRIALPLASSGPGGWVQVHSGLTSGEWALTILELSPCQSKIQNLKSKIVVPGYAAALAVEGGPAILRLRRGVGSDLKENLWASP